LARFLLVFLEGGARESMYSGTGHPEARRTFAILDISSFLAFLYEMRNVKDSKEDEGGKRKTYVRRYGASSFEKKVIAFPGRPARPVRPIRWM
jgi:hypothetical protein